MHDLLSQGQDGVDVAGCRRTPACDADFHKVDDGLKMTRCCDADTVAGFKAMLDVASDVARYGRAEQDEALMACIGPSDFGGEPLLFVDGALGGHTRAAARLKGRD